MLYYIALFRLNLPNEGKYSWYHSWIKTSLMFWKHYSYISMIRKNRFYSLNSDTLSFYIKWTLLWLILVLIIGFLFLFNLWFCAKNHFVIGYPFLSCQHHVSTYKTLSDSIHASYSTHPYHEQIYNLNHLCTTSHKWDWLFFIQIKNVYIYTSQYSIAANFNLFE